MPDTSQVEQLREDLVMRLHLTNDECPPGTGYGWRAIAEAKVDALIEAVKAGQVEKDAQVCESYGVAYVAKVKSMKADKYPNHQGIGVYEYLGRECRILAQAIREQYKETQ